MQLVNGTYEKDFHKTVEMIAMPVLSDGTFNQCYGDGYFTNAAYKKYGEERIKKAVREYRDSNPYFDNWRY